MSDDDFLLSAWYQLMADREFASVFFAFDIACRSLETGRWVQVHPSLFRWMPEGDQ